jgi:glutamate---cysteine ligase / carboxylate-amine ligase
VADQYGRRRQRRKLVEEGVDEPSATYERHRRRQNRAFDCCTSIDDAVAIANLYRVLIRHLVRDPKTHSEYSALVRALTEENCWRAQRYGTEGTYLDAATSEAKLFTRLLDEIIGLVQEDVATLGLQAEIAHLKDIVATGTSAHRQLAYFRALRQRQMAPRDALREVARWLCDCTERGNYVPQSLGADQTSYGASPTLALDRPVSQ